jgi:hypothetical protein
MQKDLPPTLSELLDGFFKEIDAHRAELDAKQEEAHKKWAEENPEQAACDHGVSFDKEAADQLIADWKEPEDPNEDPGVRFIMGPSYTGEIRKRWPRLCGECPKGCGYNGIYYASMEHYTYGDW